MSWTWNWDHHTSVTGLCFSSSQFPGHMQKWLKRWLWLGTCLHIYVVAVGLSLRAIPHQCCVWMRAQEWGSTVKTWLQCKTQATFCLAPEHLDFAPLKGAERLHSATPSKCHILGMEPPYGKAQMSPRALHPPRGETSTLQPLHCSGFVWSLTCMVTDMEVLNSLPWSNRGRTCLPPQPGRH